MRQVLLVFFSVIFFGYALPALAIDCAQAKVELDLAICSDPSLIQADRKLNDAYEQALRGRDAAERRALLDLQKDWLPVRSQCWDGKILGRQCLLNAMTLQTNFLARSNGAGATRAGRLRFIELDNPPTKANPMSQSALIYEFAAPATPGQQMLNHEVDGIDMVKELRRIAAAPVAAVLAQDEPVDQISPEISCGSCEEWAVMGSGLMTAGFVSAPVHEASCTGGAHCGGSDRNINVNLLSARSAALSDYFVPASVNAIAEKCLAQIMDSGDYGSEAIEDTADGKEVPSKVFLENFQDGSNWSFNGRTADVTFPLNTLGPYAAGEPGCSLTYDSLKRFLRRGVSLPS